MVEKRPEQRIVEISYAQYGKIMDLLVKKTYNKLGKNLNLCTGIYGIPRGGLPVAVHLSHHLGLPMLDKPRQNCIIAEDISDSGNTLLPFQEKGYFIVALFCKKKSKVVPNVFYKMVPEETWIKYAWEMLK